MAVGADTKDAAFGEIIDGWKETIAEIGLGRGAKARYGTAGGKPLRLTRIDVGRMDQTPAPVHGVMIEQPFHRTLVRPGKAIFHFLGLFGDVDVDRRAPIED